ncbi:hypothetical protein HpSP16_05880 [Helicobacter pylori]
MLKEVQEENSKLKEANTALTIDKENLTTDLSKIKNQVIQAKE